MEAEEIGRILDELGKRIGPAGEFAWTISVRQVLIESVVWITAGLVVFTFAGALVFLARRYDAKARIKPDDAGYWHYSSDQDLTPGALVFLGVAGVAALVLITFNLPSLLNPEYTAMVRLLEKVVPGQ